MNKIQILIKKILKKETLLEILKYGIVTLVSYFFLIGCIFLLKDIFSWNEKIAYALALTINYVGVYAGYNRFVFKTTHNIEMLKRFMAVLALSWLANNLFFTLWLNIFYLHYTMAVILNTIVFGGFRFLAQKFYVRK